MKVTLKKKWRRISNSDLSSNSRLVVNLRANQSIYLTFTIKEVVKEEIRQLFRITRSCQKEGLKEIQAISRLILKKRWRRTSNSDLSSS